MDSSVVMVDWYEGLCRLDGLFRSFHSEVVVLYQVTSLLECRRVEHLSMHSVSVKGRPKPSPAVPSEKGSAPSLCIRTVYEARLLFPSFLDR